MHNEGGTCTEILPFFLLKSLEMHPQVRDFGFLMVLAKRAHVITVSLS